MTTKSSGLKKTKSKSKSNQETIIYYDDGNSPYVAHQENYGVVYKPQAMDKLWYKPFVNDPDFTMKMYKHFVSVFICMFAFILGSMLIGAFMNTPLVPGAPGPTIGFEAVLVGFAHWLIFYICYAVNVPGFFLVNLNPYITLMEFFAHGTVGIYATCTQLLAQAGGAAAGAVVVFGILDGSALNNAGIATGIFHTSAGWCFFMEAVSAFLFSWIFWHNYNHKQPLSQLPMTLGMTVGVTSAIFYPFVGVSTANVFRWLGGCVVAGNCGATDIWWVFSLGSLVGVVLGYLTHLVTWKTENKKKT